MAQAALDALLGEQLIDEAGARRVRQVSASSGEPIAAVVHQLALADDERVVNALSRHSAIAIASAEQMPSKPVGISGVTAAFLRRRRILPLGYVDKNLLVGIIDPGQTDALAALAFAARCAAEPRLISVAAQKRAFDQLYGAEDAAAEREEAKSVVSLWADDTQRMRDQSNAGPAVRLVDSLLEEAVSKNASDIHIEPLPDRVRIRFRIDGDLVLAREEPAQFAASIAARIKVLANMDIADRRSVQDGRTSLAAGGRPIDVRISCVPSAFGEAVALRLLRRDGAMLDLDGLGFALPLLDLFKRVLELRRGLFLVTGPTGSGKTTTLYAMIERLRGAALKILSVEDPIEYFFPDITQVQVNEDAGLTFPIALRAFLRQDPDVILIGEIRDSETARIAVQAALTGHLVLATLHTTDAPGAVSRLADLGVDRYLIAATLAGAVSQRLARRLCLQCREIRKPTPAEAKMLGLAHNGDARIGSAPGCRACRNTGASGRIAVGEGFLVSEELRAAIASASEDIHRALGKGEFSPLSHAAAAEAASGRIALSELRGLDLA